MILDKSFMHLIFFLFFFFAFDFLIGEYIFKCKLGHSQKSASFPAFSYIHASPTMKIISITFLCIFQTSLIYAT